MKLSSAKIAMECVHVPLADLPDAGPKLVSLEEQDEDHLVYTLALVIGREEG